MIVIGVRDDAARSDSHAQLCHTPTVVLSSLREEQDLARSRR